MRHPAPRRQPGLDGRPSAGYNLKYALQFRRFPNHVPASSTRLWHGVGLVTAIFYDATSSDDVRRRRLFEGDLFVYSPTPSAARLCEFARTQIEEAFGGLDPRTAHERMPVEECVQLLAKLKPSFIHHPTSKECLRGMLAELGCDPEKTYFDVPRLRTAFPTDYLTSGIAYAFHPHRDTWYSAPMCQLNWWLPIYEVNPDNVMAFHPGYWSRAIRNGSAGYNYYRWNEESRKTAAQHVKTDTRVQPHAEEPVELDPQIRLLPKVGGTIIFSAAHLHSTVPNTSGVTRYSIDFRTVHLDDLTSRTGAPNLDSASTGTTMRDYLRATDLGRVPEDVVAMYDDETSQSGLLVFGSPQQGQAPVR
jgi:hypothetical protein